MSRPEVLASDSADEGETRSDSIAQLRDENAEERKTRNAAARRGASLPTFPGSNGAESCVDGDRPDDTSSQADSEQRPPNVHACGPKSSIRTPPWSRRARLSQA